MKTLTLSGGEMFIQMQEQFRCGGKLELTVTGTSMVPFLRHKKDRVWLEPITSPPKPGQILLFVQPGGRLTLHRLRRVRKGRYFMNGDGQRKFEVIPPQCALAVVTAITRQSGRVIRCDQLWWRTLSALWRLTWPVRPWVLRGAVWVKRIVKGQTHD